MKKLMVMLVVVLFLQACGPEISGELKTKEKVLQKKVPLPKEVFQPSNAAGFVKQITGNEKIEYGFDENNNLVSIQKGDYFARFFYKDGLLRKISDGQKSVELEYYDGYLSSVSGDTELPLHYVVENGLLKSADDYSFTYTRDGQLWIFREGLGPALTYYYEDDTLDFIKKGNVVTHFYYDGKDHLDHIEDGNNHLIIAYGRGGALASLSGNFYGLGEMFDYGDNRISVISNINESVFYGDDEINKKAFDLYVSCTRFRKGLGPFEPFAFQIYHNYFDRSVYDFMLENFYCEWLP